jgi:hypothetical protein
MEARLESLLQAKSAAGPTAPQSTEALLHHQPTRESIAAVVTRLGLASPQAAEAVMRGMASARAADRAGDLNACERALADVESAIAQAPKQWRIPAVIATLDAVHSLINGPENEAIKQACI